LNGPLGITCGRIEASAAAAGADGADGVGGGAVAAAGAATRGGSARGGVVRIVGRAAAAERDRQVADAHRAAGQDDQRLDEVLELAHVAGIGVGAQLLEQHGRGGRDALAEPRRVLLPEVLDELGEVVHAARAAAAASSVRTAMRK
jgi:hypothetical protein